MMQARTFSCLFLNNFRFEIIMKQTRKNAAGSLTCTSSLHPGNDERNVHFKVT